MNPDTHDQSSHQDQTASNQTQPAQPQFDQARFDMFMQQKQQEQNLSMGIVAGLVASIVGAAIWAAITAATGYQIGWMAIGVAFLIGYSIRTVGKGFDHSFGIAGGVLALFGCALGNLFTAVYWISAEYSQDYFDVLFSLDFALISEIMAQTFSPMDIVFYGIAVYFGYKYSFRQLTEEELKQFVRPG